jgi:hypothetical protein
MEEAEQAGSIPMPSQSTLWQKQHFKLWQSIDVRTEGKHPCKPCYLGNTTDFLNLLMLLLGATCITCIVG